MFKIDLAVGIALYIGLTFFIVVFTWILSGRKKNTSRNSFSNKKEFIWQCEICGYAYLDSKNFSISKCPRCDSYNDRKK